MPARASRRHVDWRARLRTQLDIVCNAPQGRALRRSSFPGDGRPRELTAYGPVVPTDDRSKLYARTVTVRGNIQQGNSGFPLVNTAGEILGVVFGASVDDSETGYALTAY